MPEWTRRVRVAMFSASGWLTTGLGVGSFVLGLYAVYRAVTPILTAYGHAHMDPLGDEAAAIDGRAIMRESVPWAVLGIAGLLGSALAGFIVARGWRMARLGRAAPPTLNRKK